jgi:hypothetical protein
VHRWWNQELKVEEANIILSVSCSIIIPLSTLEFWYNLHKLQEFGNCSVMVVACAAACERERERVQASEW